MHDWNLRTVGIIAAVLGFVLAGGGLLGPGVIMGGLNKTHRRFLRGYTRYGTVVSIVGVVLMGVARYLINVR